MIDGALESKLIHDLADTVGVSLPARSEDAEAAVRCDDAHADKRNTALMYMSATAVKRKYKHMVVVVV